MNEKTTYELDKILSSVEPEHFNRYRNEEDTDSQMSVSEFFNWYIGSHGLQLSDVIRQSDIPANYAYGILNGNRANPSRDRVIALCIACHMNLTDTNRALKTAGLSPLYSKVSRDAAIIIMIKNSIFRNSLIFQGLPPIKYQNLMYFPLFLPL